MSTAREDVSQIIETILVKAGAIWLYQGSPQKEMPHALLTSGVHSDGYTDVGTFLKKHPEESRQIAVDLLALLARQKKSLNFTKVVGADTSSTYLAKDLARMAGVDHIRMTKTGGKQVWDWNNIRLKEGDIILNVEELITTASSVYQVREGIAVANPAVAFEYSPYLPVVVDRSNPDDRITKVGESAVLPLVQLEIRTYPSNYCPYCLAGSQAIKPKEGNNWSLLTGKI